MPAPEEARASGPWPTADGCRMTRPASPDPSERRPIATIRRREDRYAVPINPAPTDHDGAPRSRTSADRSGSTATRWWSSGRARRAHRRLPAGGGGRPGGGGRGGLRGRGISRTVERDGWRFDIGGHRFFTKVKPVEEFWHQVLPDDDFLLRPRMSRIYYDGKFYDYPIKLGNALGQPRPGRGLPVRALLPVGADPAAQGPDHARGLHRLQLRVAALPALLQDLQREGVGGVGVGDLGRLGGPADQGHVPVERGVGADPCIVGRQVGGTPRSR